LGGAIKPTPEPAEPAAVPTLPRAAALNAAIAAALSQGGEFADAYAEEVRQVRVEMDESGVQLSAGGQLGAGVRVLDGPRRGYGATADVSAEALTGAGRNAAQAATSAVALPVRPLVPTSFPINIRPGSDQAGDTELLTVARSAVAEARRVYPEASAIRATVVKHDRKVIIANSRGSVIEDRLPYIELAVRVQSSSEDGNAAGFALRSVRSVDALTERLAPAQTAALAAKQARRLLQVRSAPSGEIPVILSRGLRLFFALLLEPALRGDLVRLNQSAFSGAMGKPVADAKISIIDDATRPDLPGSYNVDDEGVPAQNKVLIERGVLSSTLSDQAEALFSRRLSSGNGRRPSFLAPPVPRSSNLFIAPGKLTPEDIVKTTPRAVYVTDIADGQANSLTGAFVFLVREAYLVEQGALAGRLGAFLLTGTLSALLSSIDAIGQDLAFSVSTVWDNGYPIPMSIGNPTLRATGLRVVGG